MGSGTGCPLGPRDAAVRGKDFPLIEQPPGTRLRVSPEPGTFWVPVERVFEELRAHIEGIVYPTIEAKVAVVEAILAELDTDPERIKQLIRWHWIEANLHDLPQIHAA